MHALMHVLLVCIIDCDVISVVISDCDYELRLWKKQNRIQIRIKIGNVLQIVLEVGGTIVRVQKFRKNSYIIDSYILDMYTR